MPPSTPVLGQLAAEGVLDRLAADVVLAGGDLQHLASTAWRHWSTSTTWPSSSTTRAATAPLCSTTSRSLVRPSSLAIRSVRTVTTLPSNGCRRSTTLERRGEATFLRGASVLAGGDGAGRDRWVVVVADWVGQAVAARGSGRGAGSARARPPPGRSRLDLRRPTRRCGGPARRRARHPAPGGGRPVAVVGEHGGGAHEVPEQGWGRVGRERNSGWNWPATNHGWSGSSIISTRRPSGEVPEKTSPASSSRRRKRLPDSS